MEALRRRAMGFITPNRTQKTEGVEVTRRGNTLFGEGGARLSYLSFGVGGKRSGTRRSESTLSLRENVRYCNLTTRLPRMGY